LYSATLNRFLSSDPLGLAGGVNLYAYGESNPLAYIDPSGLCAEKNSPTTYIDPLMLYADGEALVQKYTSELSRDRFDLLGDALTFNWSEIVDWSCNEGRDYKYSQMGQTFEFRDGVYTASQMENIAPAYAFTTVDFF
jgi:uncharacterized protein RhaS with RHS repeats